MALTSQTVALVVASVTIALDADAQVALPAGAASDLAQTNGANTGRHRGQQCQLSAPQAPRKFAVVLPMQVSFDEAPSLSAGQAAQPLFRPHEIGISDPNPRRDRSENHHFTGPDEQARSAAIPLTLASVCKDGSAAIFRSKPKCRGDFWCQASLSTRCVSEPQTSPTSASAPKFSPARARPQARQTPVAAQVKCATHTTFI